MNTISLAYIAGFFDGEGSVLISRRKGGYFVEVTVGQADIRPLEFISARFGGKIKLTNTWTKRANARPFYSWRLKDIQAEKFITAIRPFLILKADQADLAIAFRRTIVPGCRRLTKDAIVERQRLAENIIALRKSGSGLRCA